MNGKSYIGQTIRKPERRMYEHFYVSEKSPYLKNAIAKYGKENFVFEILHEVFDFMLDDLEIQEIAKHNTLAPNGYNLESGGNAKKQVSELTRQKLSKANKGRKMSLEARRKMSESTKGQKAWNKGKKHTLETRKKIAKSLIGKKRMKGHRHSAETRQKMSDSTKGKNHHMYGKSHSDETRRKISESLTGRKYPNRIIYRHPHKRDAHNFYTSLPSDILSYEKLRRLCDKFQSVVRYQTLWRWAKKWENQ